MPEDFNVFCRYFMCYIHVYAYWPEVHHGHFHSYYVIAGQWLPLITIHTNPFKFSCVLSQCCLKGQWLNRTCHKPKLVYIRIYYNMLVGIMSEGWHCIYISLWWITLKSLKKVAKPIGKCVLCIRLHQNFFPPLILNSMVNHIEVVSINSFLFCIGCLGLVHI